MSLSPECVSRSRRSRVMIILAGQRVSVESCLPNLGSFATPVVPKALMSLYVPTRSKHTLVRDNSRSSRRYSPPCIGFLLPSGQGGEKHSHNSLPFVALPVASVMSRAGASYFRHRLIRTIPPVPSPCGLCGQGDAVGGVNSR
jgi:hypothetical protein